MKCEFILLKITYMFLYEQTLVLSAAFFCRPDESCSIDYLQNTIHTVLSVMFPLTCFPSNFRRIWIFLHFSLIWKFKNQTFIPFWDCRLSRIGCFSRRLSCLRWFIVVIAYIFNRTILSFCRVYIHIQKYNFTFISLHINFLSSCEETCTM